ncbi:hypothetical protein Pmani_015478 [Petrolisthes manimaculis]|uniref:Uncharacterized protein n=1 Tax=Petrolisthes manimaculis TaxID=1843537 RepID=A0AAE1PS75_9EUCA|nr:hypothetical protein Pmani_015478 [Petrolisthes manimaculis]
MHSTTTQVAGFSVALTTLQGQHTAGRGTKGWDGGLVGCRELGAGRQAGRKQAGRRAGRLLGDSGCGGGGDQEKMTRVTKFFRPWRGLGCHPQSRRATTATLPQFSPGCGQPTSYYFKKWIITDRLYRANYNILQRVAAAARADTTLWQPHPPPPPGSVFSL